MITITENAAKYINNYLTKRGKGLGVRLGVKTSGCSGMAYNLEFVDEANEDDLIFEEHARAFISTQKAWFIWTALKSITPKKVCRKVSNLKPECQRLLRLRRELPRLRHKNGETVSKPSRHFLASCLL